MNYYLIIYFVQRVFPYHNRNRDGDFAHNGCWQLLSEPLFFVVS